MKKFLFYFLFSLIFFSFGFKKRIFIEQNAFGKAYENFRKDFEGDLDITVLGEYDGFYLGNKTRVTVFDKEKLKKIKRFRKNMENVFTIESKEFEKINYYKTLNNEIYTFYQYPYDTLNGKTIKCAALSKITSDNKIKFFRAEKLLGSFTRFFSYFTNVHRFDDQLLISGYIEDDNELEHNFLLKLRETPYELKFERMLFFEYGPQNKTSVMLDVFKQKNYPNNYFQFISSLASDYEFKNTGGIDGDENLYLLKYDHNLNLIETKKIIFESVPNTIPYVENGKVYIAGQVLEFDNFDYKVVSENTDFSNIISGKYGDSLIDFEGGQKFSQAQKEIDLGNNYCAWQEYNSENEYVGLVYSLKNNPFQYRIYNFHEIKGIMIDLDEVGDASFTFENKIIGMRLENNQTFFYEVEIKNNKTYVKKFSLTVLGIKKVGKINVASQMLDDFILFENNNILASFPKNSLDEFGIQEDYFCFSDAVIIKSFYYKPLMINLTEGIYQLNTKLITNGNVVVNDLITNKKEYVFTKPGEYQVYVLGKNERSPILNITITEFQKFKELDLISLPQYKTKEEVKNAPEKFLDNKVLSKNLNMIIYLSIGSFVFSLFFFIVIGFLKFRRKKNVK